MKFRTQYIPTYNDGNKDYSGEFSLVYKCTTIGTSKADSGTYTNTARRRNNKLKPSRRSVQKQKGCVYLLKLIRSKIKKNIERRVFVEV